MAKHPETERSFVEKGFWWAKVGGIVAALIGVIRSMPDLAIGGAGIAVVSHVAQKEIFNRKKDNQPSKR